MTNVFKKHPPQKQSFQRFFFFFSLVTLVGLGRTDWKRKSFSLPSNPNCMGTTVFLQVHFSAQNNTDNSKMEKPIKKKINATCSTRLKIHYSYELLLIWASPLLNINCLIKSVPAGRQPSARLKKKLHVWGSSETGSWDGWGPQVGTPTN